MSHSHASVAATPNPSQSSVRHIHSEDEFKMAILESMQPEGKTIPVIVKFTANWCGPCKMITRPLDQMAKQCGDRAIFVSVDIDQLPGLKRHFGVSSIPAFHVVRENKQIDSWVGADINVLKSKVLKHLSA